MLIEELRKLPAYNFLKKVDVAREFRKLSLDLEVADKLDNLIGSRNFEHSDQDSSVR